MFTYTCELCSKKPDPRNLKDLAEWRNYPFHFCPECAKKLEDAKVPYVNAIPGMFNKEGINV